MFGRMEKADELVSLTLGVMRSVHSHLNRRHQIDFSKISPLKVQVLGFIKNQEKPSMKNLADFLAITPPSATSLIEGMAEDKLIIRRFNPSDRRVVYLQITAKGSKVLEKGFKEMTSHMKEAFGCLTEKEKKQLIIIYRKIYNFNKK
jgi:DNA-binding MarR family transcriptional regulator